MMNAILLVIGALIVVLLVFVVFSQDDQEEVDSRELESGGAQGREFTVVPAMDPAAATAGLSSQRPSVEAGAGTSQSGTPEFVGAAASAAPMPRPAAGIAMSQATKPGNEEDLRFRCRIEDQLAPLSDLKNGQGVAVVVQIRFPADVLNQGTQTFLALLQAAESQLRPEDSPFPFSVFLSQQLDRLWLFGFDEERDDAVFEALVCALDTISRFKKCLESQSQLADAKARIAIGMAYGEITRVVRGPLGPVTHAGRAVYLAETLAEAAGDFKVYVDSEIHRLSLPLFDFREWRPIQLRTPLPPIAFFEVMGWNKKEEIFAFASHQETYARRCVAVAYRYLDFGELSPLLQLLADTDERVVTEALATVSELGDERALGILKRILPDAQKPVVRAAIIEAMGRIGKEEILPVLLASSKDSSWQVRYQAVRALYRVAGSDAIRHLEELADDEDGAVRAAVRRIFYAHTQSGKELEGLRDLLTDLSVRARRASIDALIDIGTPEAIQIVAGGYREQEHELRKYLLRQLGGVSSPVLYQCFLAIFQSSDERDRSEVVAAVRRAKLVS